MSGVHFADGRPNVGGFIAEVPTISGKGTLLAALYKALGAPSYAGRNWDALFDILCDLEWIPDHEVTIVHKATPELPESELKTYLDLLTDAAVRWAKPDFRGRPHQFTAYFPTEARDQVLALLGTSA